MILRSVRHKQMADAFLRSLLYDYLLMLDDEIRYMWRGRKTSISYLYILNRIAPIAFRFYEIHATSGPRNSDVSPGEKCIYHTENHSDPSLSRPNPLIGWARDPTHVFTEGGGNIVLTPPPSPRCLAKYRAGVLLVSFSLTSSDVFIMLRVYALTFGKKILMVYFGALALTELVVSLASFLPHETVVRPTPIPLDVFNLCATLTPLLFKSVPIAIGTAFDVSAFLVLAQYAYRDLRVFELSTVVRAIVTEGTIYFLAMLAIQIYTLLSFVLMEGLSLRYSYLVYSVINPVLTMRFALSLKQSADSGGGLRSVQFTPARFRGNSSSGAQIPTIFDDFEMDLVHYPNGQQV